MVTTTTNNLRSSKFNTRGRQSFVNNEDMQVFVYNDLAMLENQDIDLQAQIDAIPGAALLKKLSYTVGMLGVAGCDYNFTAPANTTEQSIQLGATTIIPALATTTSIIASVLAAPSGGTTTTDIGVASGSDEYIQAASFTTLATTVSSSAAVTASGIATSIYFSVTPSANWSLMTLGKFIINIYYIK